METKMAEAVEQEKQITSHETKTMYTDHGHVFEPEVLAFCCEH